MLADRIRKFVFKEYIEPARKSSQKTIVVRAGDVHGKMDLSDRMPAVCAALGSAKFESEYHVQRVAFEGPIHGANARLTFRI